MNKAILILALVTLGLFPGPGLAAEVPADLVVRYQVEAHQLGVYEQFPEVVVNYDYSYASFLDATLGTTPDITTWDLINVYWANAGWLWFMAHSRSTSFDTESYEYSSAGRTARDNAWTALKNAYGAANVLRETRYNRNGDPEYYVILVTENFVSQNLHPGANMHVVHAGCGGWPLKDGYLAAGVRSYVSYSDTVTNVDIFQNSNSLYSKMASPNVRSVIAAGQNISQIFQVYDPDSTVLTPRVRSISFAPNSHFNQPTTIDIRFDAGMRQEPANNCFMTYGPLRFRNAQWMGADWLRVEITGAYRGAGALVLDSFNPYAYELSGLMSTTGIGLDGNTYPWTDVSGIPPNNDDYLIHYTSDMGGDNPAALLSAFSAVSEAAGVQVSWTVEFEHETARYRIDRRRGWTGEYTALGNVQATGGPHYTFFDQTGTTADVYRLVEVETDDDEIVQSEEQAVANLLILPEVPVTSSQADSLTASAFEHYPAVSTVQTAQPLFGWLAIIKDESYRSAIQPLVNYRSANGLTAQALTLAQVGGGANLPAFTAWASRYGLRYRVDCMDGNNAIVHDNPSSYINGWSPFSYPSQPQYNLLGTPYLVDPVDNQPYSLTYFTRHYPWVGWHTDTDGDSLPDVAYGRLPARTPAELAVMCAKTIAGDQQTTEYPIGIWGEFRSLSGLDGPFAQQLTDSSATRLINKTVRKLYNTDAYPIPYASREQLAISALVEGRTIVETRGTQSNRSKWAIWLDATQGFGWQKVPVHTTFPLLVAASCDILDFDRSEDPTYGRPLIERALLEPQKGPFAAVGFTRGTWQHPDYLVVDAFYQQLYSYGAASVGSAWLAAIRQVAEFDPGYKYQMMSAIMIGDPAVTIPGMIVHTAGVAEAPTVSSVSMHLVGSSPIRGLVTLQFTLPAPAVTKLVVYDLQGRVVGRLAEGYSAAGTYTASWNPSRPGLYFAKLMAGPETVVQKMVVIH